MKPPPPLFRNPKKSLLSLQLNTKLLPTTSNPKFYHPTTPFPPPTQSPPQSNPFPPPTAKPISIPTSIQPLSPSNQNPHQSNSFPPPTQNPHQFSPFPSPNKNPHQSNPFPLPPQNPLRFLTKSRAFSSKKMDPSPPIPVVSTLSNPFEAPAPSSLVRKPLSLWPGMYSSPVTAALWEARSSIFERLVEPTNDAPPQRELLTRIPAQSRTVIVYGFSGDYILREQYRDPWNEVRIGKLLEDLDALAGTIAVKHCSDDDSTTRPLLLVTASVDKMVLKKPIRVDTDLSIEGAVTWVGRSSIAIQIEVTQSQREESVASDPIALTANFTFVARDSKTGKAAPVNRLSPETEREKSLFEECEARDRLRKRKREEERKEFENGHRFQGEVERLKALLSEGRVFCDLPALADRDSILIRDSCLENSLICQPQQRNFHGRIFGGFLMHRAFELAFSTAYAFVGQMPCFLEVDHVDFLKPVDVGDFLRLKSCVLYTQLENPEQPLINIEVVAHVTRPELRTSEVSNTFYFTFTVNSDALKNGLRIRNVVPATEEEARRVLDRMDAEKMFS